MQCHLTSAATWTKFTLRFNFARAAGVIRTKGSVVMSIELVILFLSVFNGGWMIFDGLHVIRKGKYFGPPTPGAWSKIISKLGVDPFSIGPLFVILGVLWLVSSVALLIGVPWGYMLLLITSISTLWYIKVGTVISIITMCCLMYV